MKDMMKPSMTLTLKPSELKANIESESWGHKAKIICFAGLMGFIAGSYQRMFDSALMRSAQF